MTTERVKRKLSAILSADVKGYSRLMREDEVATVETLKAYREAMSALIQEHRGRVVDAPGDNLLAEFASVVDAVESAVEIQQELKAKNAELPENRRMEFRIGINLGDVIEEGERIYGDGVNVAARIEGLAEGRGICISRTAFDQVKNKLNLGYENLGEHSVKNIAEPVRVYRVLMEPEAAGKVIGEEKPKPRQWRWAAIGGVVVLILVAGALAIWDFYFRPSPITPADPDKMVYELPDKPSIAVLPLVNIGGDPKEDYLTDGITEQIITALSRTQKLFVIARNSVFSYKGKPVKVQKVAEELGVQYVLEGSVQRSGQRLRITAQLIDAIAGNHLWAERYDRNLEDIFALQDEITMKIITAMQVKLTFGERANLWPKGTNNLEAYLKCLEAYARYLSQTKEGVALGKKLAEEAIALDPKFPNAYTVLGQTHVWDIMLGTTESPQKSLTTAMELAKKAIALDNTQANAHGLMAALYLMSKQYEQALVQVERAISLNPNDAASLLRLGFILNNIGRPEEAVTALLNARRFNPTPWQHLYLQLVIAYRLTGRYEEAIETAKEALAHVPNNINIYLQLAATYSMTGQEAKARAAAAEVMKINPKFSLEWFAGTLFFKNKVDTDRTLDALRKAGLN